MRRTLAAAITTLMFLLGALASSASADPLNKPTFIVQCGSTNYVAVSPNHGHTFSDMNSTSQLILAPPGVPQRLLTFCTATAVFGPESVSGYFLVTPASS